VKADFDPAMCATPNASSRILVSQPFPEDHQNLLRPPTKGLSDWREQLTSEQVALCDALAGTTLRRFGYETSSAPVPPAVRARAASAKMRFLAITSTGGGAARCGAPCTARKAHDPAVTRSARGTTCNSICVR